MTRLAAVSEVTRHYIEDENEPSAGLAVVIMVQKLAADIHDEIPRAIHAEL